MRWSHFILTLAFCFAFATVFQSANAQRDLAASRDQFNTEITAIVQLLKSNQNQPGLERALKLRNSTRKQFGTSSPEYLKSLDLLAECQKSTGSLKDAGDTFKEALAVQTRHASRGDPRVVEREFELADLLAVAGDYQGSVQLYKTALLVLQKQLGASDPTVARFQHDLALVLYKAGNDSEAEQLMRQSLDVFHKGGPQYLLVVSKVKTDLATICLSTGKLDEAESLLFSALGTLDDPRQQVVGQVEKTLRALAEVYRRTDRSETAKRFEGRADAVAPDHLAENAAKLGSLWNDLGSLTHSPSAIPTAEKIATLTEQLYGPRRYRTGVAFDNLGQLYSDVGRYAEAETNLKRAVDIFDCIPDRDSYPTWGANMAGSLNNLGLLYTNTSRYAEALPLLERAHLMDLAFSGENSKEAAVSINNLGLVYSLTGRTKDAEQAYRNALQTDERASGPDSLLVSIRLVNLASEVTSAGKYDEAMPLLERARTILVKTAGEDSISVASVDGQIARVISALGKLKDAENLYEKAIGSVDEFRLRDAQKLVSALGVDDTQMSLQNGLGLVFVKEANWPEAVRMLDSAVRLAIGQVEAQASSLQKIDSGLVVNRDSRIQPTFEEFVSAAAHLRLEDPSRNVELATQTFEVAQWARASTTAGALAEMAVRGLARGETKQIVRELQDLIVEKGLISAYMDAAVVATAYSRAPAKERQLSKRAVEIDARVTAIKATLKEQLPNLANLMEFNPLSVQDIRQNELSDDEAVVLFLDTPDAKPRPEETFIWVVTKTDLRWARSDLGTSALSREVSALRCGLDYDGAWAVLRSRCPELLKVEYTRADDDAGKPLPFDLGRAHSLYDALFGQIEDVIQNKRLLIVPSGPLMQLPFQVLVTDPPKLNVPSSAAEYRDVAWLVRKHAVTVLPAASSLKALRQYARGSSATETFIGFGNPLLSGDPKDAQDASRAKERQQCAISNDRQGRTRHANRAIVYGEGGLIDLTKIRSQAPLPSTADELCGIAKELGADSAKQVFLGARATETQVKQLSEKNDLQKYQIVEFATHGAVAGDLSRISEPGLILTPPKEATDRDDGYLSASEISNLKLDADWVILSACNTAAGDAQGAEALSGLARAFFYAGARSLLVSHWAVDSDATVKLVARAVAEAKSHPEIGRAEALRRSMLRMIDSGSQDEAHPALWAPFVLVGEGSSSASKASIGAR